MNENPYAPPQAVLEDLEPNVSAAEATRRAHIAHERQLKSVGFLYFLYAAFLALMVALEFANGTRLPTVAWIGTATMAALAAGSAVLGYGFRTLRPWVRIPGAVMSGLGLLAVPVGTLINGYVLYLILNARGRVVLAPGYRAVIDATPHVRYRRTVGDWIAIVLVVLVVLGVVVSLIFGAAQSR